MRFTVFAGLLVFSTISCLEELPDPSVLAHTVATRDGIRQLGGKADNGSDLCDLLGWYGDGICDPFCLDPDPDCEGVDDPCETYQWYGDGICDPWCLEPDVDCQADHCDGAWVNSLGACLGLADEPLLDDCCSGLGCDTNRDCTVGAACVDEACLISGCGDASEINCEHPIPGCPYGQAAIANNGCYLCVNTSTCMPPGTNCELAWLDSSGNCRGPADEMLPSHCCP